MIKTILHIVGARPNFVKVSPVMRALSHIPELKQILVHSGQHYNDTMSKVFFDELKIRKPEINLNVGSGTHTYQTATTMTKLESVLDDIKPTMVMLYGDVNATLAGALVCAKRQIPISHVESGLRSSDLSMPEEINRILTDHVSELLFTPSEGADINLRKENIPKEKIHFVGNIMIDTLVHSLPSSDLRWERQQSNKFPERFGLITLHRASNVDNPRILKLLMESFSELAKTIPLIFPMHPRTKQSVASLGVEYKGTHIQILDPLGYIDFLSLERNALFVVTDSGGVQEETTFLKVPCFTVRENTERPITVEVGTNSVIGHDMDKLFEGINAVMRGETTNSEIPPLWDGNTAQRIARVVSDY